MSSIAAHVADALTRGLAVSRETFDAIPRRQLRIWFGDVSPACPSRRVLDIEMRPGNALNVEIGAPRPRCMEQSPDGRGLAWAASGGSLLAYGPCVARSCPRLEVPRE